MNRNLKKQLDNIDSNMTDIMCAIFYGTIIAFWMLITLEFFRNYEENEED